MSTMLTHLKSTSLFTTFSENELDDIVPFVKTVKHSKGSFIFTQGDPTVGFYIIIEGRVKIFRTTLSGKEHIHHIVNDGQSFSEAACFIGMPYPANAETLQDTELLFIPKTDFLNYLNSNPNLAIKMLASMAMRLKQMTDQIHALASQNVESRLAGYLIQGLKNNLKNNAQFNLDIGKHILASRIGTTPETLSRTFNKLKKNKIIEIDKKVITILDADRLIETSEPDPE